jgi:hypothetical protein
MIVYLAGENAEAWKKRNYFDFNRLASFHYMKDEVKLIHKFNRFILDSGAFTFMTSMKGKKLDWDKYVTEYGMFVKQHDIKYFFELDIDALVGIKEVERLRDLLETVAGRKCIPVWHRSRGLDYWKKMISDYDYVAIGGIVTREIKRTEYDIFTVLLRMAKEKNCKVHGLGFTNLKGMEKYKFYSVDSTSWLSGNRFGGVYVFNGRTMEKHNKKNGQRVVTNATAIHNFEQWVKFSNYAEKNL